LASPWVDWRWWRGRGELRRGRAAAAGGNTHGGAGKSGKEAQGWATSGPWSFTSTYWSYWGGWPAMSTGGGAQHRAAAAMAAGCTGGARRGARGGLSRRAGTGDERVTAQDALRATARRGARVRRRRRRRTAGPWRVRAYGGACLGAPRDGALRGARASGRGVARTSRPRGARTRTPGRGRRRAATAAHGARTTSRAARSGPGSAAGAWFELIFLKIFKQNWTK
jgi:hypothetical protein